VERQTYFEAVSPVSRIVETEEADTRRPTFTHNNRDRREMAIVPVQPRGFLIVSKDDFDWIEARGCGWRTWSYEHVSQMLRADGRLDGCRSYLLRV
jgi:hypothetical protein